VGDADVDALPGDGERAAAADSPLHAWQLGRGGGCGAGGAGVADAASSDAVNGLGRLRSRALLRWPAGRSRHA
jgi:hypothetical protein